MAAAEHKVETTYINEWVESGVYHLVINNTIQDLMRRVGVDLVDINHVLRTGRVVRSDMIENLGLWEVWGATADDLRLKVKIAVVSAEYRVELLRIEKVKRGGL